MLKEGAQTVPVVVRHKINILEVIKYIEAGENTIYILDEGKRYGWQVIQRKGFKIKINANGDYIIPVSSLAPVVFTLTLEDNRDLLKKTCEEAFQQNSKVNELPIVNQDGYIIARWKKNDESLKKIDWKTVSKIKKNHFGGKFYISSDENPKLKGLYDFLHDLTNVEMISKENLKEALSGGSGTIIYGNDIYPDIPKISADDFYEQILNLYNFDKNQVALEKCDGFHRIFSDADIPVKKTDFSIGSCMKYFLSQVESDFPVLLKDAYDIEEITWICDKLRSSEKFGADNHLYLQYTSWERFLASMYRLDWTYIAGTGKVVFIFSDEEKDKFYPKTHTKGNPQKLDISEIVEIVDSMPRGFSGSDFFNMILDSHPSLLTIGWHGLPTFGALWKIFCEGKTVKEAIEHLNNPKDKEEIKLRDVNLSNMLKNKYKERLPIFYEELTNYLDEDKCYSMCDWFKAFFLSTNATVKRKFLQRISPAVFYDMHGINQLHVKEVFGIAENLLIKEKISGFKYKKRVGVVRHPISTLGCKQNDLIEDGKWPLGWRQNPLSALKGYSEGYLYGRYWRENDSDLAISRQVRFEDLKLYPKETTEKLCDFLRIPWSETCLQITTNSEDSGVVDGTKGFDVAPVYKKHPEYLSSLDCYRIELLNYKNFDVWGYKPKYYDGMVYTKEELKELFSIPFKVEKQKLPKWPDWPDEEKSREFHEWILKRAIEVMEKGEKEPVDADGKPMKLLECLFPDLKPGQKLFEC